MSKKRKKKGKKHCCPCNKCKRQQYAESDLANKVAKEMFTAFQSDLENWSKSKRASFSE